LQTDIQEAEHHSNCSLLEKLQDEWRIRNAIAKIERCHPLLGAYLSNAIKTGTFCSYQPDRKLKWITS